MESNKYTSYKNIFGTIKGVQGGEYITLNTYIMKSQKSEINNDKPWGPEKRKNKSLINIWKESKFILKINGMMETRKTIIIQKINDRVGF